MKYTEEEKRTKKKWEQPCDNFKQPGIHVIEVSEKKGREESEKIFEGTMDKSFSKVDENYKAIDSRQTISKDIVDLNNTLN